MLERKRIKNKNRRRRKRRQKKNHFKRNVILAVISLMLVSIVGYVVSDIRSYKYEGTASETLKVVQRHLSSTGYYDGEIDGYYGDATEHAITAYENDHKLLRMFVKKNTYTTSNKDITLIARVVSGEARGEKYEGKVAVAAVIFNRVESSQFPDTIKEVIYQDGAFDAVADGQVNITPDDSCYEAVLDAKRGWDPSRGALYYYNPKTATDSWIRTREQIITIGNHVFCK